MICWFLLVPAGVPAGLPVLVSLLLSSLFPVLVSIFSLLWFRCLSPFFSLLCFLRTGVLFHHDFLVPLGPGWGSGACLPSSPFFLSSEQGFCSIMVCWFLLVPAGGLVLVSLLLSSFFPQETSSVLLHHDFLPGSGWGSGACLPSFLFFGSGACLRSSLFFLSSGKGFCSIMICWFLLVPAGVPAGVPVLVSLLLSSLVPVLVSLLLSSLVPVLVSLFLSSFLPQERTSWFAGSSWLRLGCRCLSPFFSLL